MGCKSQNDGRPKSLFGGTLSFREKLLDERYETVLNCEMFSSVSSIKELMFSIS
jgi:hypothetical protein